MPAARYAAIYREHLMYADRLNQKSLEDSDSFHLLQLSSWIFDEEDDYYPGKEYDDAIEEVERLEELEILRRYGD